MELFLKVQQGLSCYTTNLARQDSLRGKRKAKILRVIRHNKKFSEGLDPGGGTPIYGLYRYVPRNRVWFLRFSVLK